MDRDEQRFAVQLRIQIAITHPSREIVPIRFLNGVPSHDREFLMNFRVGFAASRAVGFEIHLRKRTLSLESCWCGFRRGRQRRLMEWSSPFIT